MVIIEKTLISSAAEISQVATDSFMDAVAPHYRPQGIIAFQHYACTGSIIQRMNLGNVFYSAIDGFAVIGMAELIPALNHLSMFFVAVERQRQGIGRQLLSRIKEDVSANASTPSLITVDAAPNAIGAYEHFKFSPKGTLREFKGIRFFPMILSVDNPHDNKE